MRTTLTIDDGVATQLREIVHRSGKSFKAVVNDALRAGIANDRIAMPAKPYRLKPVAMGDVVGPYDLDKALQLADRFEDEENRSQAPTPEMILVDANLLIYAVNLDAPHHRSARRWLQEVLSRNGFGGIALDQPAGVRSNHDASGRSRESPGGGRGDRVR